MTVLSSFRRHLKLFQLSHRIMHPPPAQVLPLLASSFDSRIIDSRASTHMSGTQSLLTNLSKLSHPFSVSIANGPGCPVMRHGEANPTSSLQLSQFLVNLLSINAIAKALFCSISFFPYHCIFHDLQMGKRISLGCETRRGLYELVPDRLPVGLSYLFSSTYSGLQWHQRLGHPSITKLYQSFLWISISSFECDSCQLGKYFRASYPRLISTPSKSLFVPVYCNVGGPGRVSSILGFGNYIVFADDFSLAS